MADPAQAQASSAINDGLKELLKVHLAEYQMVFNTILQLREQQNRLTNYGLIAVAAVLAAASSLYGDKPLDDFFWLFDFGALCLFAVFMWQHIYVDRTMFRLDRYMTRLLQPAIKSVLSGLRTPNDLANEVMRYEQFFLRMGYFSEKARSWGSVWDVLLGATRYAVPTLGVLAALGGLAYRSFSAVVTLEVGRTLGESWPWLLFLFGALTFLVTMAAFSLASRELQSLRGSFK